MKSDTLAGMSSLEDVIPIINSLQGFQQLDSTHSNSLTICNSLTSKKICFADELKIAFKWTNICLI